MGLNYKKSNIETTIYKIQTCYVSHDYELFLTKFKQNVGLIKPIIERVTITTQTRAKSSPSH